MCNWDVKLLKSTNEKFQGGYIKKQRDFTDNLFTKASLHAWNLAARDKPGTHTRDAGLKYISLATTHLDLQKI